MATPTTQFDAAYYLIQNPDVNAAWDGTGTLAEWAEYHFNTYGWAEGRDPNSTFDTSVYLANNSDVLLAGINPFTHFQLYGLSEGRTPNASIPAQANFNATAYIAANSDLSGLSDAEAYAHYVNYGQFEGRAATTTGGDTITPTNHDGTASDGSQDTVGSSFTFTTDLGDALTGSGSDDTFNGTLGSASPTVQAGESADGRSGNDTFNLYIGDSDANVETPGLPAGFTSTSIETVNLVSDGNDTLGSADATKFSGATQVWQVNKAAAITAGSGQTMGIRDAATTITVTGDTSVTAVSVALDNATGGGTLTVDGDGSQVTATVTGSIASNGAITLTDADNTIKTLNVGLTSNSPLTPDASFTALTTIDASSSTGNTTIAPNAAAVNVASYTGGSGDDSFTRVDAVGAVDMTIKGGAGKDTIDITDGNEAQVDTLVFDAGDTGTTAATADSVTGFTSGGDKLDFNMVAGSSANYKETLAGIATVTDAVAAANTQFDGTVKYFFGSDGVKGFVVVDRDGDGSADEAVQIGVTDMAFGDFIA
jgi:hypothetical protein